MIHHNCANPTCKKRPQDGWITLDDGSVIRHGQRNAACCSDNCRNLKRYHARKAQRVA